MSASRVTPPQDVLVTGVLILIAATLLIPATLRQREAARAGVCQNRLAKLGEAMHAYHSAYNKIPPAMTGTEGDLDQRSNRGRLSGFAALLPFLEQQTAWQQLSRPLDGVYPPMGPAPSVSPKLFPLWGHQVDLFLCPADQATKQDFGLRSYIFCYGDGVQDVGKRFSQGARDPVARVVQRGAFVPSMTLSFRDCLDGMSNTIFISETVINVRPRETTGAVARDVAGLAEAPARINDAIDPVHRNRYCAERTLWAVGKGSRWPEGSFICNAMTTNVPPNSASATLPNDPDSGCVAASSHHIGGVHVLMGDASMRMIADNIDTGDQNAPSVCNRNNNAGRPSPYGVWGALGTRASRELIPAEGEAAFNSIYSVPD